MNSSAHNAKKTLNNIISFQAAFLFLFFCFKKRRYFTVYKRRNQRHSEPQTLCVFVDFRACPSCGFCVAPATIDIETFSTCENWAPINTLVLLISPPTPPPRISQLHYLIIPFNTPDAYLTSLLIKRSSSE